MDLGHRHPLSECAREYFVRIILRYYTGLIQEQRFILKPGTTLGVIIRCDSTANECQDLERYLDANADGSSRRLDWSAMRVAHEPLRYYGKETLQVVRRCMVKEYSPESCHLIPLL